MSFDQYEFEPPDSEQSLEIAVSHPNYDRGLRAFLIECGASTDSGRTPDAEWGHWEMVRGHLRQSAGLVPPHLGDCREVILLRDDWDDLELAITTDTNAIWYHWSTTA